MSPWAKILAVVLGVVIVGLVAVLVLASTEGGGETKDPRAAMAKSARQTRNAALERKLDAAEERAERERRERRRALARRKVERGEVSVTGEAQAPKSRPAASNSQLASSFAQLEAESEGEIGVAFAQLGGGPVTTLGPKQVGHAWSSFKVPITVALMQTQAGKLTASQESLAAAAITASDNNAAASLFSDLESVTGGKASSTVEAMLAQLDGGSTHVETAPPPPGAVSSWGQTQWSLESSTLFYGAMYCGLLGSVGNVISDMENVIPEQQWGLGQASFPSGSSVAYKAGWGPDGSESGPYLVRQAGVVESGGQGFAVTIAAESSSGSFEAGVAELNAVADWVAANVPLEGSC
jgi:hypothetical protein